MSVDNKEAFNKEQSCLEIPSPKPQASSLVFEPKSMQIPSYWDVDKPRLYGASNKPSMANISTPKSDHKSTMLPPLSPNNSQIPTSTGVNSPIDKAETRQSLSGVSKSRSSSLDSRSTTNSDGSQPRPASPTKSSNSRPGMFRSISFDGERKRNSSPSRPSLLSPYKAIQNWRAARQESQSPAGETAVASPEVVQPEIVESCVPSRMPVQDEDQQTQPSNPRQRLMLSRSSGSRVLWSPESVADATPESLRKALLNTRNNRSFNCGRPPKSPAREAAPRKPSSLRSNLGPNNKSRPNVRGESGRPPMSPMHCQSIPRGHKFIYQPRSRKANSSSNNRNDVDRAERSNNSTPVARGIKKSEARDSASPISVTDFNNMAPTLDRTNKMNRLRRDHSRERQKRISSRRNCRSLSPSSSSVQSEMADMASTAAQVMAVVAPSSLESIAVKKSAMNSPKNRRSPRRRRHSPNGTSLSPKGNEPNSQQRQSSRTSPKRTSPRSPIGSQEELKVRSHSCSSIEHGKCRVSINTLLAPDLG